MTRTVYFLIPVTSRGKEWKNIKESFLNTIMLPSLRKTVSLSGDEKCIFYIGYDFDDPLFSVLENQKFFEKEYPEFKFNFVELNRDIQKGHVTVMWNQLLESAISENSETFYYFFQCGDDVEFISDIEGERGWITLSTKEMDTMNGIGCIGLKGDNPKTITQAMFTKKHYDIFGYLFPPEIKNWWCDDWYNIIYGNFGRMKVLNNFSCMNRGGKERYTIDYGGLGILKSIINDHINKIKNKI